MAPMYPPWRSNAYTPAMSERVFVPVQIAVLTISDTRSEADDRSGAVLVERLESAGHQLCARAIVRDDIETVRAQLAAWIGDDRVQAVLVTGSTGITGRDIAPEALAPLISKAIPGFGELFRWLSYEEIGTSTIQSRAQAALCQKTLVFLLPGSSNACRTAWDRILGQQLDARHRPCNFVELFDRL